MGGETYEIREKNNLYFITTFEIPHYSLISDNNKKHLA